MAFLDGTYNKSAFRSKAPPGDELAGCRDYTEARCVCRIAVTEMVAHNHGGMLCTATQHHRAH